MLLRHYKLYSFILVILFSSKLYSQDTEIDSSKVKNPSFAWKIAFIPGMGQLYNGNYFKFVGLVGAEIYAVSKFNHLRSKGNITKRNTYGWWVVGLYFYGILDAYVDAHLSSFPKKVKKNNEDSFLKINDSTKIVK